jgi:hypothetical protein
MFGCLLERIVIEVGVNGLLATLAAREVMAAALLSCDSACAQISEQPGEEEKRG